MADTEQATTRFQLIGEVAPERMPDLMQCLGQFGVTVVTANELDIVSPSVVIEYVESPSGIPVPAVTENSVIEFLLSQGWAEAVARTRVSRLSFLAMISAD